MESLTRCSAITRGSAMVLATGCASRRAPYRTSEVFTSHARTSLRICMRQCLFFATHICSAHEHIVHRSVWRSLGFGFLSEMGSCGIVSTLWGCHNSRMARWLSLRAQQDAGSVGIYRSCTCHTMAHVSMRPKSKFISSDVFAVV